MSFLFQILALLFLAQPGADGTCLSYRNLTSPESTQTLYRSGGASFSGQRVHVHVGAGRVLAKPSRIAKSKAGGKVLVFENQSLPLVIAPDSVYYQKILDRVEKGDRVCVKGEVRDEPEGGKERLAIWVHQLKRAHDKPAKDETKGKAKAPKAKKKGSAKV